MRKRTGLCELIDRMPAVHHAPVAMHTLHGIDALLSAVFLFFFGGIFKN